MGRKSIREDKTLYQEAREAQGLTRERAAEQMPGISPERIEKIENGRAAIQPEDVLMMSQCYKAPALCNYYCTHECAIGREKMTEIPEKPLGQIAIEAINALNSLSKHRDRLLEIVEDGQIRPDEQQDFRTIQASLDKMEASIGALRLWIEGQIAEGKLEKDDFTRQK